MMNDINNVIDINNLKNLGQISEKSVEEENLNEYLRCESLLSEFFKQIDYCGDNCISQEISKYGGDGEIPGKFGCCAKDYYKNQYEIVNERLDLLKKKRIEKYGLPNNNEEEEDILGHEKPCNYHTSNGCILKDHKGPLCISYICLPKFDYLVYRFDINYNVNLTEVMMTNILAGKVSEQKIKEFKEKIINFTNKVQTNKYERRSASNCFSSF